MYIDVNGESVFFSNGNGQLKPEQPNVVFVHGAGMDHSVWVLVSRYFARHHYNVYALDLPGHGRSKGNALTSVDLMADWLDQVLEVLEVSDAAVVGHSLGSLIALNFAARYSLKTRALALLGTSTPMPVGPPLLAAAKDNHHDAIDISNIFSHSSFGQMGGSENPGMCMLMSGQRLLEQAGENVLFTDLNACNEFTNGAELLPNISCETLVLIGEQDKMTAPIGARQVAKNIENSRIIALSPCGHSMLSEQPNAVLDALATIV